MLINWNRVSVLTDKESSSIWICDCRSWQGGEVVSHLILVFIFVLVLVLLILLCEHVMDSSRKLGIYPWDSERELGVLGQLLSKDDGDSSGLEYPLVSLLHIPCGFNKSIAPLYSWILVFLLPIFNESVDLALLGCRQSLVLFQSLDTRLPFLGFGYQTAQLGVVCIHQVPDSTMPFWILAFEVSCLCQVPSFIDDWRAVFGKCGARG
jgi:hypothetical protein